MWSSGLTGPRTTLPRCHAMGIMEDVVHQRNPPQTQILKGEGRRAENGIKQINSPLHRVPKGVEGCWGFMVFPTKPSPFGGGGRFP